MTPLDQELDLNLVLEPNPLHVYRLTRRKYAILSGVGASLAPGRWNRLGEEAIYTSLEKSGTVLECLAHTPKELIPSDLVMMKLRIQGNFRPSSTIAAAVAARYAGIHQKYLASEAEKAMVAARSAQAIAQAQRELLIELGTLQSARATVPDPALVGTDLFKVRLYEDVGKPNTLSRSDSSEASWEENGAPDKDLEFWLQSGASSGASIALFPSLRDAQKTLGDLVEPFAAAVPSVILPIWNVVLYPERRGFWDHVSVDSIEPFSYDPRLFPEEAVTE